MHVLVPPWYHQRGMKGGVNEVRPAFGGMNPQASGPQGAEQGQGGEGFAGVAAGAGHNKAGNAGRRCVFHAKLWMPKRAAGKPS
jgi:hypothetical protein